MQGFRQVVVEEVLGPREYAEKKRVELRTATN